MFPSRQIFASPRIRHRIAQALWDVRKVTRCDPLNTFSASNVYYTTIILYETESKGKSTFSIVEYCHFRIAEARIMARLRRCGINFPLGYETAYRLHL